MRKRKFTFDNMRLDAMLGPNTNQYWLYDNTNDVFIDPPKEVLDILDEKFGDCYWEKSEEKQRELLRLAKERPSWLFETEHWYGGDTEI